MEPVSQSLSVEPRPIKRLSENIINKIAAGEIIQRPASALKELLENSLDAGSTSIKITVKDGGLKLLQIQDNGCGIRRADLPILAERFTTSKLSTFSDLSRIATFGFRGEALASISHVARLSVVTKTKSDLHAWRASYEDGVLIDPKTRQPAEPRPHAGNDGTVITIEDLFYNTTTRLAALKSASDEYSRILDVVTRYAIHNPKVAFFCKKAESSSADISTPSGSDTLQAIRLLYGGSIAKELLNVKISSSTPESDDEDAMDEDEEPSVTTRGEWRAESYFTSPNYQAKKTVFLLFINHRLVESPRIKRALEGIYQGILPKGACPFIYLSLEIDPRSVDVNVHPTKREVHFLNEEVITQKVADTLQSTLAERGQSRRFEYQTLLTGGIAESSGSGATKRSRSQRDSEDADEDSQMDTGEGPSTDIEPKKKVYAHHKIRTSLHDRTLDSMVPIMNSSQIQSTPKSDDAPLTQSTQRSKEIKESKCFLTSVKDLRERVVKGKHTQLSEILEQHTFVGVVDMARCLSLIQHRTKLYLVNHGALAEELFYQLGLRQFGDFKRIKLKPAPFVRDLVKIAVDVEESLDSRVDLSRNDVVERVTNILISRRDMLSEYFSLDISPVGKLESIPLLLRDYTPNLDNLPGFLMRLGPQVDWNQETECFETFLRELAYFYVPVPSPSLDPDSEAEKEMKKSEAWQLEHVVFPAFRKYFAAPKTLLEHDVVQVANLPDLYKIFERC